MSKIKLRGNYYKMKSEEEIIESAQSFKMDNVLERYKKDYSVDEETARRIEKELKRYLALLAIHPRSPYGMRGPVDDLWHTFIFFTSEYFDFCEEVAGRYLHHIPNSGPSDDPREQRDGTYKKMLEAYAFVFKEDPPSDIWPPLTAKVPNRCNDGCSSCDGCSSGSGGCKGGCSGCNSCN